MWDNKNEALKAIAPRHAHQHEAFQNLTQVIIKSQSHKSTKKNQHFNFSCWYSMMYSCMCNTWVMASWEEKHNIWHGKHIHDIINSNLHCAQEEGQGEMEAKKEHRNNCCKKHCNWSRIHLWKLITNLNSTSKIFAWASTAVRVS